MLQCVHNACYHCVHNFLIEEAVKIPTILVQFIDSILDVLVVLKNWKTNIFIVKCCMNQWLTVSQCDVHIFCRFDSGYWKICWKIFPNINQSYLSIGYFCSIFQLSSSTSLRGRRNTRSPCLSTSPISSMSTNISINWTVAFSIIIECFSICFSMVLRWLTFASSTADIARQWLGSVARFIWLIRWMGPRMRCFRRSSIFFTMLEMSFNL